MNLGNFCWQIINSVWVKQTEKTWYKKVGNNLGVGQGKTIWESLEVAGKVKETWRSWDKSTAEWIYGVPIRLAIKSKICVKVLKEVFKEIFNLKVRTNNLGCTLKIVK